MVTPRQGHHHGVMNTRGLRAGTSLAELVLTLAILGCAAAIAVPRLSGARDEYAVRAARDAAAALVDRARLLAQLRGSARLDVDPVLSEIRVESPIGTPAATPLRPGAEWRAALAIAGSQSGTVSLDFDAHGLGRVANRTIRFRRGDREARLTLSTYGRVRRW
jgi:type II secretory pathway pseudopilin PulG